MAREEIKSLRSLIRTRQRAVNNKISRLKSTHGAVVGGSQFDPRRELKRIDRYNEQQLRSYLNQLNSFMSRKNQFVPGVGGTPIPRQRYQAYLDLAKKDQERIRNRNARVAGATLPGGHSTVGERVQRMHGDGSRRGMSGNVDYARRAIPNTSFVSASGLEKMIKNLEKRTSSTYTKREIRNWRNRQAIAMAKTLGDDQLIKEIRSLTDDQFVALWTGTDFADAISNPYLRFTALADFEDETATDRANAQWEYASSLVSWAKGLRL